MKLVSSKPVGQRRVYDIEVADVHNFYANGVNVHNCATDGGVSVIKDDGSVVDITRSARVYASVVFYESSLWALETIGGASCWIYFETIPTSDITPTTQPSFVSSVYSSNYLLPSDSYDESAHLSSDTLAVGGSNDLTLITGSGTQKSVDSSVAYITSTYNTGWMNGDIKLATLSDTDATNVTGTELVTNGTDWTGASGTTPPTGWYYEGTLATFTVNGSGQLVYDRNGDGSTNLYQAIPTVVGKTYTVSMDYIATSPAGNLEFSIVGLGAEAVNVLGTYTRTFTATGTSTTLSFRPSSSTTQVVTVDNVTCRLAEEDRSVNGNGLQVFGTVTKTPVATGADLVAYSGFSASNYLQQPHNPDLDFGTGDFCVMGWVKLSSTAVRNDFATIESSSGASDYVLCTLVTASDLRFQVYTGTGLSFATTAAPSTNQWFFYCGTRTSSGVSLYLNGVIKHSVTQTVPSESFDYGSGTLIIGAQGAGANPATNSSLALWRISGTAPTAEQIAKIYEDEKVLFQDGAQATLFGASDAVTALAYDDDTELLHVGTSAGRSVFQGLRRVDNTTDAVGSCISAVNNLVAED